MKFRTTMVGIALLIFGSQLHAQQTESGAEAAANPPSVTFTRFDLPGPVVNSAFNINPAVSINPAGAITGYYADAGFVEFHGFLRAHDGTITTFDVPGAVSTSAFSINPAGAITGTYLDASFTSHGFLRTK